MKQLYEEDALLEIIQQCREPWELFVQDYMKHYGLEEEPEMGNGPIWDAFMSGLVAAHSIIMSGRYDWWE